jgi:hypothetical protein
MGTLNKIMEQENKVLQILEQKVEQAYNSMRTCEHNLNNETNPKYIRMFKKMFNEYRIQWHCLSQTLFYIKRELKI